MSNFAIAFITSSTGRLASEGEKLKFRKIALAIIAAPLLILAACNSSKTSQQTKQYQVVGKVVSIDKPNSSLVIDAQEIKGFMPAMAMPYQVKDTAELNKVSPGDSITADLFAAGDHYWIQNIQVTQKGNAQKTSAELQIPVPGEDVPNFELVNQSGKKISLGQYRGKALIVTFIYTQCPFPDYCPRVTQQFAEINKSLLADPSLSSKTHLLSISFDPKHDTPKILRDYGSKWTNEKPSFSHWEFAAADSQLPEMEKFFGLTVTEENGAITHSLSTTVIGPDGKIIRWYHGNQWTSAEILQDAAAAINSHT
jgi:protein SCO1/2